jgi:multidrug efflux pump subunit AcrA (membrane-fusion protein)
LKKAFLLVTSAMALSVIVAAGYWGQQNSQRPIESQIINPATVPVSSGLVQQTVTAPGQFIGTAEKVLGTDVSGRLIELNVRPGSRVKAGEVLAKLDPKRYEQALADARLELERAESEYAQTLADAALRSQNSEALVGNAQAQFPSQTAAEVNLQAAIEAEQRADVEYDKALNRPWDPPEVTESYRLELERAKRQRQISQAEYDQVLNLRWAASQQVTALQTDLERANLAAQYLENSGVDPSLTRAVERAEKDLAATTLLAPFDGVILAVNARNGEFNSAGTDLMLLSDPAAGEVRTTVIEEDLSLVKIGQAAEIYFDARPDLAVQGKVNRIVPQRVVGEARSLYHVYIELNESVPEGVFSGMTADASIVIEELTKTLRLPRALVSARSDGTATVEIWQAGQNEQKEIEVGLRGDVYIAVLNGLEEGDEVVAE